MLTEYRLPESLPPLPYPSLLFPTLASQPGGLPEMKRSRTLSFTLYLSSFSSPLPGSLISDQSFDSKAP